MKDWLAQADKSMNKMWTKLTRKSHDDFQNYDPKRSGGHFPMLDPQRMRSVTDLSTKKPQPQPQISQAPVIPMQFTARANRIKSLPEKAAKELPHYQTLRRGSTATATLLEATPRSPKVCPSTSQLGLYNNDAGLKYVKRRVRQASDFDQMLETGFPKANISFDKAKQDAEYTLFISLTPRVAQNDKDKS